jgi:hypothetical protein
MKLIEFGVTNPHFSQPNQNGSAGLLAGCPEGLPALRAFAKTLNCR